MTTREFLREQPVQRLLLLGGRRPEPIEAARQAGIAVTYVGPKGSAGSRHIEVADWVVLFEDEPEDLVDLAAKLHQVAPIGVAVSMTDRYMTTAARINERLGLVSNRLEAVCATQDKARMRQLLERAAVRQVRSSRVRTRQDIDDFIRSTGFPVIVKPVAGTASQNICRVDDPGDVAKVAALLEAGEADHWLAEEFLDGQEFSVETFSMAGEHHVLAVTEKFKTSHFVEIGHLVPARVSREDRQAIADEACAALSGLGITEGPAHTEIILTGSGPCVVETHARPGGDAIVELVRLACGVDIQKLTFDWLAGLPVRAPIGEPPFGAAAIWFLTSPPGTVTSVTGLQEAQASEGVYEAVLMVEAGDAVTPLRSSADRQGFVIATAVDAESALARARGAVDCFGVEVAPQRTLPPPNDRTRSSLINTSLQGTKVVLLLDPVRNGANYKPEARRRGFAVVSAYTVARDLIEERWPDHATGDDASIYASDSDAILEELKKLGAEVVAVVAAMDSAVHVADVLADELNLTGNDVSLAPARRNKAAMRRAASEGGLQIPEFALVKDAREIAAAAARIGFPAIVKHTNGGGSHGTRLLNSAEEAAELSNLQLLDHFGWRVEEWLVEQYIRGREFAVNCFSHDGRHQVIDVWEYRQPDDRDYDFPYWESAQLPKDDPDWQRAVDYVSEALTVLGVRLGPSHTEVKVGPDGVYLIEVGARLPGGPMTDQWLANSDLDPFEQGLDCYLGNRPACLDTPPRFERFCGASAIRNEGPAGTLTEIRGLDELPRIPGVDKVLSTYEPGDHVPVTDSTKNIPVGVWVSAPDYPALIALLARVRETVELVIEPDGESNSSFSGV